MASQPTKTASQMVIYFCKNFRYVVYDQIWKTLNFGSWSSKKNHTWSLEIYSQWIRYQFSIILRLHLFCCVGVHDGLNTDVQPKFHETLFVDNFHINGPNVLKFCTEHGSVTAVLCAKFQNDSEAGTDVMDEQGSARLIWDAFMEG